MPIVLFYGCLYAENIEIREKNIQEKCQSSNCSVKLFVEGL